MSGIQQIHEVGAKALQWLHAHRDGFRLEDDPSPEVGMLDRFQPLGELALISKVIFREGVAGSQQASLARSLLDFAWHELLDSGHRLLEGQRREPLSCGADGGVPAVQGAGVSAPGSRSGRPPQPPARQLGPAGGAADPAPRHRHGRAPLRARREPPGGRGVPAHLAHAAAPSRGPSKATPATTSPTPSSTSPTGGSPPRGFRPRPPSTSHSGCPCGWTTGST